MRKAIVNLTGGGICGGYRKYITRILPLIAKNPAVEAILCASPPAIDVQTWLYSHPKIEIVQCKPFRFMTMSYDSELHRQLDEFAPDVIFVPVERTFNPNKIPLVIMVQNMEPYATNINGNSIYEKILNSSREAYKKLLKL